MNSVNAFNIGKTSLLRVGLNIKILFSIFHKLPCRAEESKHIVESRTELYFYEILAFIFRIHATFVVYFLMFTLIRKKYFDPKFEKMRNKRVICHSSTGFLISKAHCHIHLETLESQLKKHGMVMLHIIKAL